MQVSYNSCIPRLVITSCLVEMSADREKKLRQRDGAVVRYFLFAMHVESTIQQGRIIGVGRRITPFSSSKTSSNYNFKWPSRCSEKSSNLVSQNCNYSLCTFWDNVAQPAVWMFPLCTRWSSDAFGVGVVSELPRVAAAATPASRFDQRLHSCRLYIRPIHHHHCYYPLVHHTPFISISFELSSVIFTDDYHPDITSILSLWLCTLQCYLIANRMRAVTVLWIVHGNDVTRPNLLMVS